jgi:hypothetical protein
MGAAFRRGFDDDVFEFTGHRDAFGPSPSPAAVNRIIRRAVKCETRGLNEAAWFSLVHSEVLALALENETWDKVVDYLPWYAVTLPLYPPPAFPFQSASPLFAFAPT